MEGFEQAIQVVFSQDPSIARAVREQAHNYCEAIKARPDCWRFCWEQFAQRSSLEVKFWCLQTLPAQLPRLSPDDRRELRTGVLTWLRDVLPAKQEEAAIRNKIALVYVGLLRWDYPSLWPTAWTDLIGLLDKGTSLVDMFLKVLETFDQEVVSEEVPRTPEERQKSHQIKHAMREGDVARLAECWYVILTNFRQSAPQLVVDCLRVMSLYIVWIEILTVANDKFLGAICGIIAEAGPASLEACECLAAVLAKKMPPAKKVSMFEQLQMLRRLGDCVHRSSTDLRLLEREAGLFNEVGEVALEAYEALRMQSGEEAARFAQAAWEILKEVTTFVFWFFSHQDCQVAVAVEPFLTAFFAKVRTFVKGAQPEPEPMMAQPQAKASGEKKKGKRARSRSRGRGMEEGPCHTVDLDQVRPILQQTLQLSVQRAAYPDWFQHDDPNYEDDERHMAFLEFRRSLTKIFKRIFLIDEAMGFLFVQASVAQLTQRLSAVRPMEVESVLYLYKETGEIVKEVSQHLQANGALATSLLQLLDCAPLVQAQHWAVQLALLEVYVRYSRVFALHPELFASYGQRVLGAFLGPQGVRATDTRVVKRACYLLSRFIKSCKQQAIPAAAEMYEALKDLLVVPFIPSSLMQVQADGTTPKVVLKGALKVEDQAYLFEALATLVSAMPPEQMRPALQRLLEGPAGNLAEILNAQPARLAADVQGHASWASRAIDAIATISKSFTVGQACAAPDWEGALAVVGRVLEKFAGQAGVDASLWKSSLFLCRRMVEVLGDHFLGPLDALLPFLYASSQAELTELTTFAHQIVCQYQKKTEPLLRKWLHVLFLGPFDVWRQMLEQSEQLKREKFELGCALLLLLRECAQRCPAALLEPMLVGGGGGNRLGPELTSFLLMGMKDPRELKAVHLALHTWSALLECLAAPGASKEALATLPLAQLLQQVLWATVRMNLADALAQKALGEAAAILRGLTSPKLLPEALHEQVKQALQQALVGALPGLRSDAAPRVLCEALGREAALKEVRAALQQCATEWRKDCGPAAA